MLDSTMKWGLYSFKDKTQTESGEHRFSLVRDASADEVDLARSAIADLATYSLRESFIIVVYNYEMFAEAERDVIESIETALPERPTGIAQPLRYQLLNWLLSARAFIESTETQLARRYGRGSPQVARFKTETNRQYDSRFGYRFVSKLRNYAQHWDWPVLDGRIQVDVDETPSRWLELFFRKEPLLAFEKWGSFRQELEALPDEIHLEDPRRPNDGGYSRVRLSQSRDEGRANERPLDSLQAQQRKRRFAFRHRRPGVRLALD